MVEQVLRVADELAFGVQGEACAKRVRRALVQRPRREVRAGRAAAKFVCGELVAPANRIPQPGVIAAEREGALQQREPFGVTRAARYEDRPVVLQRFDVIGVELQRAPCELDPSRDIVRRVAGAGLFEERAGFVVR